MTTKTRKRGMVLLAASLAALGIANAVDAAQISSSWTAATNGNWVDAAKWSGGVVPNNGGANTFTATIGAAGPAYTVSLGNDIALDALTLNSTSATLNHTTGTLSVVNPITVSAGTYMLNGGVINGGTINLSGSGTMAFGGIAGRFSGTVVNGGLTLSGGSSFARFQNGARFTGDAALTASSALLNFEHDATIQSGQTITLDSVGASLGIAKNSTTNTDSTLTIASGATVRGRGGITSGNFSGGSSNAIINNGTVAADVSGGSLNINPNIFVNNGVMQSTGGATLTVAAGSFTNNGSISANGGSVVANATNWTNAAGGRISATNGTLTTGGNWSNAGSISINNSTLNLGGTVTTAGLNLANFSRVGGTVNLTGSLDNTAATLPLTAATGSWRLVGGTVNGGTITRAGGAELIFTSSPSTLKGTSVIGDLTLTESSGAARLQNGADFTGNATLTGSSALINYEYDATIGAGRTINLDGPSAGLSVAKGSTTDSTLTIASGAAVRGQGQITSGNYSGGSANQVINNGTISADLSGKTLTINPNIYTNNGHTRATNGSTLSISAGTWTNAAGGSISVGASTANFSSHWSSPGALNLTNGATLNMGGTFSTGGLNLGAISRAGATTINLTGNLNNAASTLALTGTTGSWRLAGGSINGGSIMRTGGADLIFTNASGVLNGTSIMGDVALTESSSRVSMREGADFTGNATLAGNSTLLNYEYDATIGAGRTINLEGIAATLGIARGGTPAADRTLTIAPGAAVRGRGQINSGNVSGGSANRVVNNGAISSDVTGATLTINPNLFTNNAALRGVNGSTLTLSAPSWSNAATGSISLDNATANLDGAWTNAGNVILSNNATLNLGGTMTTAGLGLANFVRNGATTVNLVGTLDNNASTLALNSTSGSIRLNGGTITGGTVTRSGGADLVFTSGSGVLRGTSVIGDVALTENSARVRMREGADFSGNATLSGASAMINYEYDATIGAGRTIALDNPGANLSVSKNDTAGTDSTLTIAPGATVRGRGQISTGNVTGGATNHVVNNGLVHADVSTAQLLVNPSRLTNNGVLQASAGSLNISSGSFTNGTGRLRAVTGGQVKATAIAGNLNDSSADGAGSMIELDGTSYTINQPMSVTNDALLYLRGGWQKNADMNVGGRIIFDYATGAPSPFLMIKNQVLSGFASGAWNGPGINSTEAAASPAHGVAYAEMPMIFGGAGVGVFSGVQVDRESVLVAYTRYGDANMDFVVNLSDFNRLAASFGQIGKNWSDGDFNYDGLVNLTDFNRLAANFGLTASPGGPTPEDWSTLAARVPEPTVAVPALCGLVALCGRRTRRSR